MFSRNFSVFLSKNRWKIYPVTSFLNILRLSRQFISFSISSVGSSFTSYGWTKNGTSSFYFKCTCLWTCPYFISHAKTVMEFLYQIHGLWLVTPLSALSLFNYLSIFLSVIFDLLSSLSNHGGWSPVVVLFVSLAFLLVHITMCSNISISFSLCFCDASGDSMLCNLCLG